MFSIKGRMNRLDFFARSVILGLTQVGVNIIYQAILRNIYSNDPGNSLLVELLSIVVIIIAILLSIIFFAVTIRRWHDLGNPGWWVIFNIIPLLNIFVAIYLVFKKGESGINKYGAPN